MGITMNMNLLKENNILLYQFPNRQVFRPRAPGIFFESVSCIPRHLQSIFTIFYQILVLMDILWQISARLFDYSWHLWQTDVQTLLHGFSTFSQSYNSSTLEQHHDDLFLTCERWLLCLKIIRRLIVSGFPSDAKCVQVGISTPQPNPT